MKEAALLSVHSTFRARENYGREGKKSEWWYGESKFVVKSSSCYNWQKKTKTNDFTTDAAAVGYKQQPILSRIHCKHTGSVNNEQRKTWNSKAGTKRKAFYRERGWGLNFSPPFSDHESDVVCVWSWRHQPLSNRFKIYYF